MATTVFADTYNTGSDNDLVTARTPVTGASYSRFRDSGDTQSEFAIKSSVTRLSGNDATGQYLMFTCVPVATTPSNVSVTANIEYVLHSALTLYGLVARLTDYNNCYVARANFFSDKWELMARVDGTDHSLASSSGAGPTIAGTETHTLKVTVSPDADPVINVYDNGSLVIGPITDSTYRLTTGDCGGFLYSQASPGYTAGGYIDINISDEASTSSIAAISSGYHQRGLR